jgi:hypothetical protein
LPRFQAGKCSRGNPCRKKHEDEATEASAYEFSANHFTADVSSLCAEKFETVKLWTSADNTSWQAGIAKDLSVFKEAVSELRK